MSTEFTTTDGTVLGLRFSGGKERGLCLQLEFTEAEWVAQVDCRQAVVSEGGESWEHLHQWMQEMLADGATVIFDSAARQNDIARELENHRFADHSEVSVNFARAAITARNRAKSATKAAMSLVEI